MASMSFYSTYLLLVASLLQAQHASALGERFTGSRDVLPRTDMVGLLKMSITSIYERNAKILNQELIKNLALVESAVRGDMGPLKRGSTTATSLGGGALYFLAREVAQTASQTAVQANKQLFEQAG
ncbi:uncharacterized protein LOC117305834 [Asterias rubens]|uniref:uncharacterized protein LOC117305834 n=1 Tax=Asterias rubens TaxID=7604 RepID=UPI001455306E|nr:uncharacterized protein LOC117305834 [Asterias rubens]